MLKIYGHSDDTLELNGDRDDTIGCYSSSVMLTVGEIEAKAGEDAVALRVHARHAHGLFGGTWSFEVGMVDEDILLPDWEIRLENQHGYSPALIIECPIGTKVQWVVFE
jgi:hypothetical protein